MRTLNGWTVTSALIVLAAARAEACSASEVLDAAKHEKDENREVYDAARQATESFLDDEMREGRDWIRDEPTIDAGVGTLIMERAGTSHRQTWRSSADGTLAFPPLVLPNDGRVASDWWGVMNERTVHGRNAEGDYITNGPKIRDHVRMHVIEVDARLRGTLPSMGISGGRGALGDLDAHLNTTYGAGTVGSHAGASTSGGGSTAAGGAPTNGGPSVRPPSPSGDADPTTGDESPAPALSATHRAG